MAMGNVELMHKCFPRYLRMGTAKWNKTKKQKKVRREVWILEELAIEMDAKLSFQSSFLAKSLQAIFT